jgi:hypothetical protein
MRNKLKYLNSEFNTNFSWLFAVLLFIIFLRPGLSVAQISPGELTDAHSRLEGISNCIKCHEVGKKVLSSKCLDCHKEIKELIDSNRGYHSSSEVRGKECYSCHNEHHGKKFEIIRFDTLKFEHKVTRFELLGKHNTLSCKTCHKPELIKIKKSQKTSETYLGLGMNCLDCHADYHQQTLSTNCLNCHNNSAFKPVLGFDHKKTKFPLIGSHQKVECSKCHKVNDQNGIKYQKFSGIAFSNCTDCHKDVHENKFGKDCRKCHSEESFKKVAGLNVFNHDKTDYPLQGKHQAVECKLCHKQSLTAKIKFNLCSDCHKDYHKGQFKKPGLVSDCKDCHTIEGFTTANFTVEQHNNGKFRLEGSHAATPCISCHKKGTEWSFKDLKKSCVDCHENIHLNNIDVKFFGDKKCENCHDVVAWSKVKFDHNTTDFKLVGKHAETNCKKCHFRQDNDGTVRQKFSGQSGRCLDCHTDIHQDQFDTKENASCTRCHGYERWKPIQFNHDNTRFKLDGSHKDVACAKCHKEVSKGPIRYIQYKFEDIKCASCHLH